MHLHLEHALIEGQLIEKTPLFVRAAHVLFRRSAPGVRAKFDHEEIGPGLMKSAGTKPFESLASARVWETETQFPRWKAIAPQNRKMASRTHLSVSLLSFGIPISPCPYPRQQWLTPPGSKAVTARLLSGFQKGGSCDPGSCGHDIIIAEFMPAFVAVHFDDCAGAQ